jgi:hypothetical protein
MSQVVFPQFSVAELSNGVRFDEVLYMEIVGGIHVQVNY